MGKSDKDGRKSSGLFTRRSFLTHCFIKVKLLRWTEEVLASVAPGVVDGGTTSRCGWKLQL
jgi:hypothetical protein